MPKGSYTHSLFGHVTFRTAHNTWKFGDSITFLSGFNPVAVKLLHIPQLQNIPGTNHGKMEFHSRGHKQLLAVFEDIDRLGLMHHIATSAGSFNMRLKKPTSGHLSHEPSNHAFGIAIDLNSDDGSLGGSVAPVAPVFQYHGFKWGISFQDPMHFEIETFIDNPRPMTQKATVEKAGNVIDLGAFNLQGHVMIDLVKAAGYFNFTILHSSANAVIVKHLNNQHSLQVKRIGAGFVYLTEAAGVLENTVTWDNVSKTATLASQGLLLIPTHWVWYPSFHEAYREINMSLKNEIPAQSSISYGVQAGRKSTTLALSFLAVAGITQTVLSQPTQYHPPAASQHRLGTISLAGATKIALTYKDKYGVTRPLTGGKVGYKLPGGAIYLHTDLSTDADGSPNAKKIDPEYGRLDTAFPFAGVSGQAKYVDAEKVPYFVLPANLYKSLGIKKFDFGVLIWKDKFAYATFGDVSIGQIGEGSVKAVENLGWNPWNTNHTRITSGIPSDVITIVFPGSAPTGLKPSTIVGIMQTKAKARFQALGGKTD